ncbi:hypothetical protein SEA_SCHATZIE_203 [Mycobacterium phage Schatzie]|nr:hypothetical protein SEA_SCHATZIE_203 [Mycobacterium phage Schatzie]
MKVYQIYDQHTDAYTAWAANDEADAIAQYIAENPPDLTVEQVWPAEQVWPVYCEGDDTAKYPLEDWRQEVVNGDTQLGYAEWLAQRLSAHWWGL